MVVENGQRTTWEGFVDWRNRPALRGHHGGMLAASFALAVESLEHLSFSAIAGNIVTYLIQNMHFSLAKAATNVTDYMATSFLLALLGGFLSDAFFTTYHVVLGSAVLEFLGLVILTVQAHLPSLQPPPCNPNDPSVACEPVNGGKGVMLFLGLYLTALGIGGIKGSLPSHGALQFDDRTPEGRKGRSTYFNYFIFSLSLGAVVAVTLVVWVEDNKGWEWGLGIAAIAILLAITIFLAGSRTYKNKMPSGSPLATIFKVFVGAAINSCIQRRASNVIVNVTTSTHSQTHIKKEENDDNDDNSKEPSQTLTKSFSFLDKAIARKPIVSALECTTQQVEDVKIVLKMAPIFACTIMLTCCVSNLNSFSIQQASTMDNKIGSLKFPPPSLSVFHLAFILILVPVFDHLLIPFARKVTKNEMGITHLQRIGIGLVLSILAMVSAALIESKRKGVAIKSGLIDSTEPLPISIFWITLQFLLLGSSDLFTLEGLLEFFFVEAPASMKSLSTSLSWASSAMGFYLSTVIVSIINSVTGNSKHKPWLSGSNLNHFHLERFYWVLGALSVLNFGIYLAVSSRYKYKSVGARYLENV